MGNNVTRAHLEGAKKTGCLNLSNSNMREIPPQLLKMADLLRNLDVSCNKLGKLPCMDSFTSLKILNIASCHLKELPASICNLTKLENLIADGNDLSKLPDNFGNLKLLKNLSLKNNKFDKFPNQLLNLTNLSIIDLSNNSVSTLPQDINFTQCIELNLNNNQLINLPPNLSNCPKLKVLRLNNNSLTIHSIPPQIFKDSTLCIISLDGNKLLEKELQTMSGYAEYMERYTLNKRNTKTSA